MSDVRSIYHNLPLASRPSYTSFISYSQKQEQSSSISGFWLDYLQDSVAPSWPTNSSNQFSTTKSSTVHWKGSLDSLAKLSISPAIATRIAIFIACGFYGHSRDVTLGIVRSGRDIDIAGSNEIIGAFVSVLPSRLILSPGNSLLQLCAIESEADRKSRANQVITLGELSKLQGKESREDLFNILVTYQSLAELDEEEENLAIFPIRQPPDLIRMPTGYALSVEITPLRLLKEYELVAYYDETALAPEDATQFLNLVIQVLETFVINPETKIKDLKLGEFNHRLVKEGKDVKEESIVQATSFGLVELAQLITQIQSVWENILRLPNGIRIKSSETFSSLGGDSVSN